MSHGIQELDIGYVNGTTWHNLPQYEQLERPVTLEEARKVMCYPLEKTPLFRVVHGDEDDLFASVNYEQVDGAHCIIRTDHNKVMVPTVGDQFVVLDNSFLLDFVSENLLGQYPELEIESVGTLFNGATAFLNLKVAEYQIKGDKSPTLSRLMYFNPLGKGSYQACAHDVRIVCNNTLRASAAQGAANKTLAKFRHTKSAGQRINDHLADLAELKLGLEKHVEALDFLASKPVVAEEVTKYLNFLFPLPVDDNGRPVEGRATSLARNKQDAVREVFESDQGLCLGATHTRYGLLQATTNYFDHNTIRNGDDAARAWDGIVGDRANKKDTAFKFLMNA